MQKQTIDKVREFHDAFGVANHVHPTITDNRINALRINLLREEVEELQQALVTRNLTEVLDALTDIQYVLDGAYLQFGLAHLKEAAFNEVHRSNMGKLDENGKAIFAADGKVVKSKLYSKPNLAPLLK